MRHTLASLRVLVVLPFLPEHEGGAAARCALALLQGLSAHGVQCSVLAPAPEPATLALADGPEVQLLPAAPPTLRLRVARLARPGEEMVSGRFAQGLRELADAAELVHLVEAGVGGALAWLERPTLLQLHNLTLHDRDSWRLWDRRDRDALHTLRAERRALRRARWVLANSQDVAALLPRRIPAERRAVAPLALDPAHYLPPATLAGPVAGLIGNARWPPTAAAVRRLLEHVWPLVLERRPDATLVLAGEGMEPSTFGGGGELAGVQWRGRVPSAVELLRELGVLVYPLPAGTGTKVKVLEALALGVPVVTTRAGAEGLVGRGGVTVAEDDQRIAQATVALLEDAQARARAGSEARENFLAHHAPKVAAAPVVALYRRMLGSSGQLC